MMDDSKGSEPTRYNRSPDEKFCFACGRTIHATARDCPFCGAAQQTPMPGPSASPATAIVAAPGRGVLADQVFCRGCGKPIHRTAPMCPHCGAPQGVGASVTGQYGHKSKSTAGLLALLLGGLGIHKFYLDQPGLGILYLLFSWTFIPALIGLIEGIVYLTMSDEHFSRKYG